MPPRADRRAKRPIRPIPLIPIFMQAILLWRDAIGIADLVQTCPQRHAVERREWKAGKDFNSSPYHRIEFVQQCRPFRSRPGKLSRVRERPCAGHEFCPEVRTKLSLRRVAK